MKRNLEFPFSRAAALTSLSLALAVATPPFGQAAEITETKPAAPGSPSVIADKNLSLKNEIREAIDRGALWLSKNQDPKGYWSTGEHAAVTGLALVALQGRQESEGSKTDPAVVQRGYDFLKSCVQPDGSIYSKKQAL
ncbi:MAG TPA: hypothetical protein VHH73_15390, partial [Verrucomicrobiae bacterium]|nr:hypothetical protein [Verrucomicrobiae bacterium]